MAQTALSAIRFTLILTSLWVWKPDSWGQSIGINFTTGRGNATGTVTQAAGVEPQTNWNNVSDVVGNGFVLRDSQGKTTTAQLPWNSNNPWSVLGSSRSGGNDGLMNAYLDTTASSITTITVSNVPYKSYKVIIYFDGDAQGRAGDYTVNGSKKTGLRDEGNWVRYTTSAMLIATGLVGITHLFNGRFPVLLRLAGAGFGILMIAAAVGGAWCANRCVFHSHADANDVSLDEAAESAPA